MARLESRGQWERRAHSRHRYVQELHLTDAGREVWHVVDGAIADIERQITDAVGPDDIAQLRALLDRVAETVRDSSARFRRPIRRSARAGRARVRGVAGTPGQADSRRIALRS
ncbi:hypothetical protein [Streptomyces sp. NPDC097610]|uniref:hypothetical protein n=1 Tax=Streptomyces sp. NPDC097610 TaxID=3157227 RepID=UPI00332E70AD